MIEPKSKPCKGTGQAKGYGCGKLTKHRVYGLGKMCCYSDWLLNSENGKIKLAKSLIIGKKKNNAKINKKEKERTAKMKIELMSSDQYRSKYVQPLINKIARFIDYGNPCIATGNFEGKMAGGHYTSVGSNRTICLNLHNIFIQSFHSNSWNGGDDKRYREGLKNTFGDDYLNFIESLKAHRPIQLRKLQLIEIKEKAQKIVNDLDKNKEILAPKERVIFRNKINNALGIYDEEFSQFIK